MVTWEPKHVIQYAKTTGRVTLALDKPKPAVKPGRIGPARQGYNRKVVEAFFLYAALVPQFEYVFHVSRQWRFDLAWPWAKVALEVQGGIWTRGRHVRGVALKREWEKLNAAAILGWKILYCEPKDLCTQDTLQMVRAAVDYATLPAHRVPGTS